MSSIVDARKVTLTSKRVLFDTNIWILLNAFCGSSEEYRTKIYSAAYKQLIQLGNVVVVNDYVLSEFCNRCTKFEYDLLLKQDPSLPRWKDYRCSDEFRPTMESVRDTCLNILDDCEFVHVGKSECVISDVINEYCLGALDFSDLILADHCTKEDLFFMTDDADFADRGLNLITANKRLIKA